MFGAINFEFRVSFLSKKLFKSDYFVFKERSNFIDSDC